MGSRIRLRHDIDRFPHFIARKGSTGVVTRSDDDLFSVKMDEHIDGAEEWGNEVMWTDDFLGEADGDVEVMAIRTRRNHRRNATCPKCGAKDACDCVASGFECGHAHGLHDEVVPERPRCDLRRSRRGRP